MDPIALAAAEKPSQCDIIFKTTTLAVEKGICADVFRIVSQPRKKDEEIEVRFGYTIDSRHKSGLSNNGVEARQKWYALYNALNESGLYQPPVHEKTLVEVFGSLRKITDLQTPGKPIFQDKKKNATIDLYNFQVKELSYYIRLSTSTETIKPVAVSSGKPDFKRVRTRASFMAKNGTHRFDLTYAGTGLYEVEIEYLSVMDLPAFFKPIKIMVYILKGSSELITTGEFSSTIRAFNNFFVKEARFDVSKFYKRGLPQPINLKRHHLKQMNAYATTNKLNGTRMVGIFLDGEMFLINMVGQVSKAFSGVSKKLDGTVIDLEYFKETAYGFDVLFMAGKDVRGDNLDVRLGHLDTCVKTANNPLFQAKQFFLTGDIHADTLSVFEIIDKLPPGDNDGIIFTPITEPYFNGHIYKWKPPSELTIDFTAVNISVSEHKYNLQVKNKQDKLVTFSPPGFSGTIVSMDDLKGVGEYRWEDDTFKLVRARPDKDVPNFIDIANDVWEDIRNPLTRELLLELLVSDAGDADRDSLRKFNNSVKRDLIQKYLPGLVVLDLGAGKGGDLGKYAFSKIKKLYAVEPNPVNLKELESRAEAMKKKNQLPYTLIPIAATAQSTQAITTEMKMEKAGADTMFFSLSFFFENKMTLDELIRTLTETTDKGSLVIGTTIDGESTRELLKGRDEVTMANVTIRKLYSDFQGPIGYNKLVTFVYSGSQTVAEEQTEFLVDWSLMVQRMQEASFTLENSRLFEPPAWMSQEEAAVAKLYRTFVFKRGASDTLPPPPAKKAAAVKKSWPSASPGVNVRIKGSVFLDDLNAKDEKDQYDLVRTGTHNDGDCFFHAVLTSMNTGDYRKKKAVDQKKQTKEFRKGIPVSKDRWMALGGGSLARIGVSINIPGFDVAFHNRILGEGKKYVDDRAAILISFGNDPKRLARWTTSLEENRKIQDLPLMDYVEAITRLFKETIKANLAGTDNSAETEEKAIFQFDEVVKKSIDQAYMGFLTLMGSCGSWVGQEVLEIVADAIDRDIYILESYDGAAYKTECAHVRGRTSIVLVYQAGNHYESVGRVLPGNVIQREFAPDDPMIKLFKEKIC